MSFFRELSTRYLKDAKKVGYTWIDLIKKTTRENVIRKVVKHKMDRALHKAMKDTIRMSADEIRIQKKEKKVKRNIINREHEIIVKERTTDIKQLKKALKGFVKSFEIDVKYDKDPLTQLQNKRKAVEYHITKILTSMKGLKFIETLKVAFEKL